MSEQERETPDWTPEEDVEGHAISGGGKTPMAGTEGTTDDDGDDVEGHALSGGGKTPM